MGAPALIFQKKKKRVEENRSKVASCQEKGEEREGVDWKVVHFPYFANLFSREERGSTGDLEGATPPPKSRYLQSD